MKREQLTQQRDQDERAALGEVCMAMERMLAPEERDYVRKRHKLGEWHYIPLGMHSFVEMVRAGLAALPPYVAECKFIDVGCGIGTKVLAARALGWYIEAFGIEKDPTYVDTARKLVKASRWSSRAHILKGDALRHDYSPYDLIYFYRPLMDYKKQDALERRIVQTAKPGAVVSALGNFHAEVWDPKVVEVLHDKPYSGYPLYRIRG